MDLSYILNSPDVERVAAALEQIALGGSTAISGKLDKQQGAANAGKALIVGSDGLVGFGSAGIPDDVKVALLACMANVAWSDNKGRIYYDALYNALYATSPTPSTNYIEDGLFAHWDGINNTGNGHDGTVKEWTDLISGQKWTPLRTGSRHAFGDKYLNLNPYGEGGNADLRDVWQCPFTTMPSTIEVVFETDLEVYFVGWFVSKASNTGDSSHYIGNPGSHNSVLIKSNALDGDYSVPEASIKSVSAVYGSTTNAYINGIVATQTGQTAYFTDQRGNSENYWGKDMPTDKMHLGGSPFFPITGKIYAIRLYNRALTAAEIAHNYAVDVARFGLE